MNTINTELFFVSTADDESNYFTDEPQACWSSSGVATVLRPGVYRVIDGELCLVVAGVPPHLGHSGRDSSKESP